MGRDLDREDRLRELKMQEASLRTLAASPGYKMLDYWLQGQIEQNALSFENAKTIEDVQVLRGQNKALRSVRQYLGRELSKLQEQLEFHQEVE